MSINDQEICAICLQKVQEDYTMIDNAHEKGKYHMECLRAWLEKSLNGVLTQDKITGYHIYAQGILKQSITLETKVDLPSTSPTETPEDIRSWKDPCMRVAAYVLLTIIVGFILAMLIYGVVDH